MKKLAVTGITGKSGKYFFEELLKNQEIISNKWSGIKFAIHNKSKKEFIDEYINSKKFYINCEYVYGNLSDENYNLNLCNECDTLLHIAGIHTSLGLVKAAIKQGVKRIILVHTTGIYSKYKAAGEEYRKIDKEIYKLTKESNVELTILRPTMIYGELSDNNVCIFIKMVDKFKIMPTVNGAHYELQPVHCKDLGKAYYSVLVNPKICNGKDYILSGGEPIELRDMFNEIAKNLGVKRKYISCPFIIAYIGAVLIWIFTFGKKDFREKVQRLCEPRVYDYKDATNDFGYNPMTFKEGIIEEVKEYKKIKNKDR